MRMGFGSWKKSIAPLLIVLSLSAPGCKSGWKMPGSGMWPWSRTPSAESLAASAPKPSLESPAAKHTPASIASTAAGTKPTTPGMTTGVTTAGVPATTASYPGATSSPTSTTTKSPYGGAATANGYQTGPYGMSGLTAQAGSAPGAARPAGPAVPPATTGYPSGNYLPNSYAGTAGLPGAPASSPYGPPPTGTPSSLAGSSAATNSLANQPAPAGSFSMPNAMPNLPSSMPSYTPSLPPASGPAMASFPGAPLPPNVVPPTASAGSLSTPTVSTNGFPLPPAPTSPTLPPSSYSVGPAQATAAATPATTSPSDGYRPGSTGRANAYNFGSGSATVPVNQSQHVQSTTIPLPPQQSGYGSFQLPPNTAATPSPQQPTYR